MFIIQSFSFMPNNGVGLPICLILAVTFDLHLRDASHIYPYCGGSLGQGHMVNILDIEFLLTGE